MLSVLIFFAFLYDVVENGIQLAKNVLVETEITAHRGARHHARYFSVLYLNLLCPYSTPIPRGALGHKPFHVPTEIERMKYLHVDNIITDYPVLVREILYREEDTENFFEFLMTVLD